MLNMERIAQVIEVNDDLRVLTKREILEMIQESNALILDDHFELSKSGIHTSAYFQYVLFDSKAVFTDRIAKEMATHFTMRSWKSLWFDQFDCVLTPSDDAMILAMWTADNLGVRESVEVDLDEFHHPTRLALGFKLERWSRVLIVDSIAVTGKRMSKLIEIVQQAKAQVAGIGLFQVRGEAIGLVGQWKDRYGQVYAMTRLKADHYDSCDCPFCKEGRELKDSGDYETRRTPIDDLFYEQFEKSTPMR